MVHSPMEGLSAGLEARPYDLRIAQQVNSDVEILPARSHHDSGSCRAGGDEAVYTLSFAHCGSAVASSK